MWAYIVRRLLLAVLVIFGVSIITFILAYLVPADPARVYAGSNASAQTVASIRRQLGLDQPLPVQYLQYVGRALHGDFGTSYKLQTPVLTAILSRFPYTAALAAAGIAVELLIGIPIGILSATRPRSWLDRGAMGFALLGVAAPQFWLGLVLLYTFGYVWPIFPLGLAQSPSAIVLPAITVGLSGGVWYARVLRSSMLETLGADYVRTARAKGLRGFRVILRHALPNAITPIVTQLGLDMAYFLGGIVVVEGVFGWPGVGQLAYQAIQNDDIPLIMGTVLFSALVIVLINIVIDVLYAVINPRVVYN
ncbi:MAG TPA: ABC transporter permease [Chloroflexota bacterium]|jgi:peptide/nickel transport system permease protein|nr:ABC transporter permease [Chloroflexota bacterium]